MDVDLVSTQNEELPLPQTPFVGFLNQSGLVHFEPDHLFSWIQSNLVKGQNVLLPILNPSAIKAPVYPNRMACDSGTG